MRKSVASRGKPKARRWNMVFELRVFLRRVLLICLAFGNPGLYGNCKGSPPGRHAQPAMPDLFINVTEEKYETMLSYTSNKNEFAQHIPFRNNYKRSLEDIGDNDLNCTLNNDFLNHRQELDLSLLPSGEHSLTCPSSIRTVMVMASSDRCSVEHIKFHSPVLLDKSIGKNCKKLTNITLTGGW